MTLEELLAREGIRKTLALYNWAGDRLRVDEFVRAFTRDALFEAGGRIMRGDVEIRAWMEGWSMRAEPAPRFVRHNLTTCHIEVTEAGTASARTYYVAFTEIGPDHSGYYTDRFRRVGADWLIPHRKVRLDWASPASIFVPADQRPPD